MNKTNTIAAKVIAIGIRYCKKDSLKLYLQALFAGCLLMVFSQVHAYGYTYQSLQRPLSADMLFKDCATANLKPGTERSRFCDLWDQHITDMEKKLDTQCRTAGERIIQTAENVEGVIIRSDNTGSPRRHFHEHENYLNYVMPSLAHHYRTLEIASSSTHYRRYVITNIRKGKRAAAYDSQHSTTDKPSLRYEVLYKILGDTKDHRMGFYGDLTTVTDRQTGELLAEREFYYYIIGDNIKNSDGQHLRLPGKHYNLRYVVPCKNYAPRSSSHTRDQQPRSAYEFVSRVAQPVIPTRSESLAIFDLTYGMGRRYQDCVGQQSVGPYIDASNLIAKRVDNELILKVKNTDDELICKSYFQGPHFPLSLLFYNDLHWEESAVLQHGNIKGRKR